MPRAVDTFLAFSLHHLAVVAHEPRSGTLRHFHGLGVVALVQGIKQRQLPLPAFKLHAGAGYVVPVVARHVVLALYLNRHRRASLVAHLANGGGKGARGCFIIADTLK